MIFRVCADLSFRMRMDEFAVIGSVHSFLSTQKVVAWVWMKEFADEAYKLEL